MSRLHPFTELSDPLPIPAAPCTVPCNSCLTHGGCDPAALSLAAPASSHSPQPREHSCLVDGAESVQYRQPLLLPAPPCSCIRQTIRRTTPLRFGKLQGVNREARSRSAPGKDLPVLHNTQISGSGHTRRAFRLARAIARTMSRQTGSSYADSKQSTSARAFCRTKTFFDFTLAKASLAQLVTNRWVVRVQGQERGRTW